MARKAQKPPRTYTLTLPSATRPTRPTNLSTVLWAYGGWISDEKGVPDIVNPAEQGRYRDDQAAVGRQAHPADSFASTVTSWNNEMYQKGRALIAINPATIMGWLLVNDKELADKTGIAQSPGPCGSGSFAEADADVQLLQEGEADGQGRRPRSSSSSSRQPGEISKSVEGGSCRSTATTPSPTSGRPSKFAEMRVIAENGRIREWPALPQPWLTDVQQARFTLSDMLNKVLNENMKIEDAQEAQKDMMDSYNKLVKPDLRGWLAVPALTWFCRVTPVLNPPGLSTLTRSVSDALMNRLDKHVQSATRGDSWYRPWCIRLRG